MAFRPHQTLLSPLCTHADEVPAAAAERLAWRTAEPSKLTETLRTEVPSPSKAVLRAPSQGPCSRPPRFGPDGEVRLQPT